SGCGTPHDSMTSFIEVFSVRLRSILLRRVLDGRKKSRSPWRLTRTENGFTSIDDACVGISVFKSGRTRSTLKLAGAKGFVFTEIAVDLPAAQATARVHDFPTIAAKDLLHFGRRCLYNGPVTQAALT